MHPPEACRHRKDVATGRVQPLEEMMAHSTARTLIADGILELSRRFVDYDWFEGYPDRLTRGFAASLLSSLLLYNRDGTAQTGLVLEADRKKVANCLREVTGAFCSSEVAFASV